MEDPKGPLFELEGFAAHGETGEGLRCRVAAGASHAFVSLDDRELDRLRRRLTGQDGPLRPGCLRIGGEAVALAGAADALDAGIAWASTAEPLAANLTVAEAILLGRERGRRWAWLESMRRAAEAVAAVGGAIDVERRCGDLAEDELLLVRLARLFVDEARILVLDRLGEILSESTWQDLLGALARRRAAGAAVLILTRNCELALEVADAVTPLGTGGGRESRPVAGLDGRELFDLLAGRPAAGPSDLERFLGRHDLTEREVQIVECLLAGCTNKEICVRLDISVNTVKTHLGRVYQKTGVDGRVGLINAVHALE